MTKPNRPKIAMLKPRLADLDTSTSRPLSAVDARIDPFYSSKEWRAAREISLALHAYRCAKCTRRDGRLFVDHIVELADGGAPLDQANLEPLCGSCHTAKTGRARFQRYTRGGV